MPLLPALEFVEHALVVWKALLLPNIDEGSRDLPGIGFRQFVQNSVATLVGHSHDTATTPKLRRGRR